MKNPVSKLIIIFLLTICITACTNKVTKVFIETDIAVIPKPKEMKLGQGYFTFDKKTVFITENVAQSKIVMELTSKLKMSAGIDCKIDNSAKETSNIVQFITDTSLPVEGYKLFVDTEQVLVYANDNAGFFYAIQSLRQLLPEAIEFKTVQHNIDWIIPVISINDAPRFGYRGLMMDVSRHFFEKDYLKELIDNLSLHKINTFHLHLVDDQGWRIEIKKYPKLTEIGGFRVDQEDQAWSARPPVDSKGKKMYGGFYTQEDIKEIVAYAQSKFITVIPEIEMPAHVSSAVAAYPELSCQGNQITVPSGGLWPITDIYCAGQEYTFEFLENVLSEVMDLFPSKYIHIGGDEATKTNWKTCEHCQKRMKIEGLQSEEELQSYFIKRMERFISTNGRILVGWDEILEGGLAPGATVMSWRGFKGGLEAAKEGHNVIMTPNSHCYFDHYQGPQNQEPLAWGGYLPLSKVYTFDPVDPTMSNEEGKHVLGGQANLWSEYIPTTTHSDYMIFPRIAALSEAVWTPVATKNWEDFSNRIDKMFTRYEALGINYAKSAYSINANAEIDLEKKSVKLILKSEFPTGTIKYALDNTSLKESKLTYSAPITIDKTTEIKAVFYKDDEPMGKEFNETIRFHKAVAKKVSYSTIYSDKYKGAGSTSLVNTIRGSKNFHDGQWQGWIQTGFEGIIDLDATSTISKVTVGTLERQGSGIYFPNKIEIQLSKDGINYTKVANLEIKYAKNAGASLKDFVIEFPEQKANFVKVLVGKMDTSPNGGGTWLFIDEILVD